MRRALHFLFFLLLAVTLAPAPLLAAGQWIKVSTPHFELYTTAGEKTGRDAILQFERVRGFFLKAGIKEPSTSRPVLIVGFQSRKEFEPYRPRETAYAYYLGGGRQDYIVMQSLGADTLPIAIHEYVHLLVRYSGVRLPLWLNEGLADFYSTLKPVGNRVEVGIFPPSYVELLRREKLLDLETLTKVDANSPYYNETNRVRIFYSESWALTHMLQLSEQYGPKYLDFLQAITSGSSAADAFQQCYGKSLAQVQRDLEAYVRATSYKAAVLDVQLEKASENPRVQPASEVETGLVLADLLDGTHQEDAASERRAALAQKYPDNWEIPEAQGYAVGKRSGKAEDAVPYFRKAAELGSTDPVLYFSLAVTLGRTAQSTEEEASLLQKALQIQPDYTNARLELARVLYAQRQYGHAVATLSHLPELSREQALQVYGILAYCYHQLGNDDDARQSAERFRQYARSQEEIAAAGKLMERIAAAPPARPAGEDQQAASPTEGSQPGGDERPHILRRLAQQSSVPEQTAPGPPTHKIQGTLEQLDCLKNVQRITILASGQKVSFAIVSPDSVKITGAASDHFGLACGKQQPRSVVIEFEIKADVALGTSGVVRGIEFQ